jgi:uncharacterized protein (TIGR00730 family)
MTIPRSLCVYCGSSTGAAPAYRQAAAAIGHLLGENRIDVIYGGGRVGLMGVVADAALAAGGRVVGVIPRHIVEMEVAHEKLSELHVVATMHQRKKMMVDRAEAFLVLPGGLGTLDETFEILTWKQLGLHDRPVVLLNVEGYWDPILAFIDHAVAQGFIRERHARLFQVVDQVDAVIPLLAASAPRQSAPSGLI